MFLREYSDEHALEYFLCKDKFTTEAEIKTGSCSALYIRVFGKDNYYICKRVYYGRNWHDYGNHSNLKTIRLSKKVKLLAQQLITRLEEM